MTPRPLFSIVSLMLAAVISAPALAQEIFDPIPERIAKGDIRIELKLVAEGLNSPLVLTPAPDKPGRLYLVDQPGQIRVIEKGKLLAQPWLDLSDRLVPLRPGFDERGFLGLAFHPDYNEAGSPGHRTFYTYTSEPADGASDFPIDMTFQGVAVPLDHHSVLAEWKVDANGNVDLASRRQIMRIDQPQFNHNGGDLVFGPDAMLYFPLGDGGAGNDLAPGHTEGIGNGQDTTNLLATIVRIDPTGRSGQKSANGQYSIPGDNPFVRGGGLPEIWAYGLRNVWRMSFDGQKLIAADVGQNQIEEVNIIRRGGNYGWPAKEGTFYFIQQAPKGEMNISRTPPPGVTVPPDLIDPVVQYDHDEGISITGGFVYRGKALANLRGLYVFGEWRQLNPADKKDRSPNGRLFYSDLARGTIHEFVLGDDPARRLGENVTAFGRDAAGELYVLTNNHNGPIGEGGKVWKIVPAAQ